MSRSLIAGGKHQTFLFVVLLAGGMAGCTATRFLAEDEKFYTGFDINIEAEERIPNKGRIMSELREVVRPDPTPSYFGISRPRVWVYYAMGTTERGVRSWIQRRVGRPPVLFDRVNPDNTANLMRNRLHNNGFFDAAVDYDVRKTQHTARVTYSVRLTRPHRITKIEFPLPESDLERAVLQTRENSMLRPGDVYNLQVIRQERERIDQALKEKGFFYFTPEYLKFLADTSREPYSVHLYLTVRPDIPPRATRAYTINRVYVYPDYSLEHEVAQARADTIQIDGIHYITREHRFRPSVIVNSIFLRPGDMYQRQNRIMTINRLMGLGVFKFANVRFRDVGDDRLDAHIFLTPVDEQSLRLELQAVSKSNDFAGPGLNASYRNRNLRQGAEHFSLHTTSGFETQLGGAQRGLDSYEIGVEAELLIPRIIAPFTISDTPRMFVPRTRFKAGYQLLNRVNLFRLNSFNALYGYVWNQSMRTRHELNPLVFNYVRSGNFDPEFERLLQDTPLLRRGFEQQFIIGLSYSYFYNNQIDDWRRNHAYVNVNVEESGNILHLARSLMSDGAGSPQEPYKIFGLAFSQYARADLDFRYYFSLSDNTRLVSRFIAGAAIPYGNSDAVPYVKQFFIGGTNSVRAFPARSVGPGSYRAAAEDGTRFLVDRTGDIRIETNLEYRFPLVSLFRGALFLDAGNIWMISNDEDRPGGAFAFNSFLGELAVGAGVGFRLDASFFVLRLDIAFPLRKPYLPPGERWVIGEINVWNSEWRRQNLTYNLAIGYPF